MKVQTGLVVGVLMLTATLAMGAGEKLDLKVSPAVAFAPASLVVRTVVQSDAENRAIEIVAESDDYYRSSEVQLDGDHAPRTNMFEFRSLPPGMYEVRATLLGAGGEQRAEIRQHVNIISSAAGQ